MNDFKIKQEMGFSKVQSENAIRTCGTVQAALESILMYSETDKCRSKFQLKPINFVNLVKILK